MEIEKHIVEFWTYCPTCVHKNKQASENPCHDCMNIPSRENSKKPEFYKERNKKSKK